MELRDYLRIVRRRWVLIVACFLAAVAAAALLTSQMTPQYESRAQLFVSTSSSSTTDAYQGSLFSTQRVSSYADLVTGKEIAQRVISDLDLDTTPAELTEKVTSEAVPETVLLTISVTDPNPREAQRLTRAYSEALAELVADLETPPGRQAPVLKATIVDSASLPKTPVSPQPLRNLGLAGVLGLLLGLGLAVLRETLDTSVKTAADVSETVGTSVMAGIAFDPDTPKKPLVTQLGTHEPRFEAFRILRTNLQFVDVDSTSKAYVVTSSVSGEGKSTTAVNIALTMAEAGQKVLLVDGDLRRPQVAKMLKLESSVGVTTAVVGRVELDDALQAHGSGLTVLTSGTIPPNPAELLQSHAMEDLIIELRKRFDTIIFDAPPLLPVTDAALLAAQTDGALIVVRHGQTTREQLHGAQERLVSVGATLLGVVFNMVPTSRGSYGYGYGYGYAPDPATLRAQRKEGRRRRS